MNDFEKVSFNNLKFLVHCNGIGAYKMLYNPNDKFSTQEINLYNDKITSDSSISGLINKIIDCYDNKLFHVVNNSGKLHIYGLGYGSFSGYITSNNVEGLFKDDYFRNYFNSNDSDDNIIDEIKSSIKVIVRSIPIKFGIDGKLGNYDHVNIGVTDILNLPKSLIDDDLDTKLNGLRLSDNELVKLINKYIRNYE